MHTTRLSRLLATLATAPCLALSAGAAFSVATLIASPAIAAVAQDATDQIIFRDGRIVKGIIDSETETSVSIFVMVGSIRGATATVYQKSDILSVVRGAAGETTVDSDPGSIEADDVLVPTRDAFSPDRKVVYHIKLDGWFGRDVNVTPLKQAVEAARKLEPDYLLIEVNNTWGRFGQDLGDDRNSFDQFGIADEMEPLLRQNLVTHWEKKPEVVVWVKNAMAGAAFIPFFSPNVYFSSNGRMGGIGDLGDLFEGVGDQVVVDKQRSLRLARAIGMAAANQYDENIIRAMTWRKFVLYYTMEGGKPVYHTAATPGAELLTDDGEGSNADNDEQKVRGEGNDVLTLRAEIAQKLGVSKGTADSVEDIMFFLGIVDNYELVADAPERIMDRWSSAIDRLERDIPRMFREFNEINVQGDYNERKRARGQQINMLRKIISQVERYQESLAFSRIGVPPVDQLRVLIERIRLQQLADQP
jgi:hypothetical protein